MARPIARLFDADTWHDCGLPLRIATSKGVFVNKLPVSLLGDPNTVHQINGKKPCSIPHIGNVATGSPTVYINGRPVARVKSIVASCGVVCSGSPNVYVK